MPTVTGASVTGCTEGGRVDDGTTCTWTAEETHTCSDVGAITCSNWTFSQTPSCVARHEEGLPTSGALTSEQWSCSSSEGGSSSADWAMAQGSLTFNHRKAAIRSGISPLTGDSECTILHIANPAYNNQKSPQKVSESCPRWLYGKLSVGRGCSVPTVTGASVTGCTEGGEADHGATCTWTAEATHTCTNTGAITCDDGAFNTWPPICVARTLF